MWKGPKISWRPIVARCEKMHNFVTSLSSAVGNNGHWDWWWVLFPHAIPFCCPGNGGCHSHDNTSLDDVPIRIGTRVPAPEKYPVKVMVWTVFSDRGILPPPLLSSKSASFKAIKLLNKGGLCHTWLQGRDYSQCWLQSQSGTVWLCSLPGVVIRLDKLVHCNTFASSVCFIKSDTIYE